MANKDYKNGKLVEIIREFNHTGATRYEINGINQAIAVPFWRIAENKFNVIPKGSYKFINESGNNYLEITDNTILEQATQFQICYVYSQISSKYIEEFPELSVMVNKYNELVDDATKLFSYLKSVGMTSDTLQLTKVLSQLEPLTTWFMDNDGEIKTLPISDLYGKFNQMIEHLKKILEEYATERGLLSKGIIHEIHQPNHGFIFEPITYDNGVWRKADISTSADGMGVIKDNDKFYFVEAGEIEIPKDALDKDGQEILEDEYYYLNENGVGLQREEPLYYYQPILHTRRVKNKLVADVNIETMEDLRSQVVDTDTIHEHGLATLNDIPQTFDTIARLQKSFWLREGQVVEVLGYYEAGDGAGHKRIIASEDDGSGVQLNNGLWANIVHNGEVNVSWFGADNSLSHLENGRKLTMILKLPQVKKVNIDKSLNAINIIFSEDKEIDGMGNTITGDSNNPIILYKLQELHPKGIRNLIFKDCKVAIFSESNYNFVLVLNDIKFIDCKKAIEYKSPIGSGGGAMLAFSRFENIEFIKSEYCIYLDCSNKSSCYANYIQFNNIKAYHCQAFIYANNIKQMIEWNIKFLNMEASVTTIEKLKTDRYGVVILENCTSCVFNIYNSYIEYVGSLITVGEATANQFKQGATLIEGTKNTYQKDGLYLDDGSSGEKAIYNFNYGAFNTKDCSRIKFQITDTSLTLTPAIIKSNGNDKEISFIASRNNVLTVLYEYPLKHGEFLTNRTDVEFGSSKGIFYIELSKGTVNNLGGMIYDSSIKWSYDKPPFIYKTGSIERNMNIYKFKEEIDLSQMTSSGEFSYAVSNVRHLCFLKNIFDAPLDILDGGLVSGNVNLINGQFNLQTNGSKKYFILAQTGNICFNDTNFIFKGNENIEFIIGQNNVFTFENCTFDFSNFTGTVKFTGVMICMFRNIKIIGEKKVYFGNGVTALNNPFTANLSQLGTTYMATKMQQEGVYNDYISYMDEKTAYDKQQEKLEKQRQLAYEQALEENPELTYEEFMSVQPMILNLVEEPQPSEALKKFMEKYL